MTGRAMTTPTIEDLCRVAAIANGVRPERAEKEWELYAGQVIAVLDALKPVVAEAWANGCRSGRAIITGNHNDYADRIIAQLKGESRE